MRFFKMLVAYAYLSFVAVGLVLIVHNIQNLKKTSVIVIECSEEGTSLIPADNMQRTLVRFH